MMADHDTAIMTSSMCDDIDVILSREVMMRNATRSRFCDRILYLVHTTKGLDQRGDEGMV